SYFTPGATVIRVGGGERLERGDSFAKGSDCLGLVWIGSAAEFHQIDRDGSFSFCFRAVLAQQVFADGERLFVIRHDLSVGVGRPAQAIGQRLIGASEFV